jgi:hypothetical protein
MGQLQACPAAASGVDGASAKLECYHSVLELDHMAQNTLVQLVCLPTIIRVSAVQRPQIKLHFPAQVLASLPAPFTPSSANPPKSMKELCSE